MSTITGKEVYDLSKKIKVVYGPKPPATEGKPGEDRERAPFFDVHKTDFDELRKEAEKREQAAAMYQLARLGLRSEEDYFGTYEIDMKELYKAWLHLITAKVEEWTGIIVPLRYADIDDDGRLYAWAPHKAMSALLAYMSADKKLCAELVGAHMWTRNVSELGIAIPEGMAALQAKFKEEYEHELYKEGELAKRYAEETDEEETTIEEDDDN